MAGTRICAPYPVAEIVHPHGGLPGGMIRELDRKGRGASLRYRSEICLNGFFPLQVQRPVMNDVVVIGTRGRGRIEISPVADDYRVVKPETIAGARARMFRGRGRHDDKVFVMRVLRRLAQHLHRVQVGRHRVPGMYSSALPVKAWLVMLTTPFQLRSPHPNTYCSGLSWHELVTQSPYTPKLE